MHGELFEDSSSILRSGTARERGQRDWSFLDRYSSRIMVNYRSLLSPSSTETRQGVYTDWLGYFSSHLGCHANQYAAIVGYSSSLNMICSTLDIERRVNIANIFTTTVTSPKREIGPSWIPCLEPIKRFGMTFCSSNSPMLLILRSQE